MSEPVNAPLEPRTHGHTGEIQSNSSAWAEYIYQFAKWVSFWTLTFSDKDRLYDVTREESEAKFRRLVSFLNKDLFGNNYRRIVGHSYFSYALSFEYQKRGVLHMHALVSRRTNWEYANGLWRRMAGIIKIKPVEDSLKASRYLAKYISKGGEVIVYRSPKYKEPAFKPMWYLGEELYSLGVVGSPSSDE